MGVEGAEVMKMGARVTSAVLMVGVTGNWSRGYCTYGGCYWE